MTGQRTVTITGIVIGGAYQPPATPMGSEAERIQSLLLEPQRRPVSIDWIVAAIAVVGALVAWWLV